MCATALYDCQGVTVPFIFDSRKEHLVHMAKIPSNSGKPWTPTAKAQLNKLADGNTPTRLIAYKLQRSEASVRAQASSQSKSLKPVNQSPYNRKSK